MTFQNSDKEHDIKPFHGHESHTWVGPPHPVSNLRLKKFPFQNLTEEEKHFYDKSREVQEWNQKYWELHNRDFVMVNLCNINIKIIM